MSYDECKTAFANSSIKPSSMHGDNTLCAYSGQYGHGICQGKFLSKKMLFNTEEKID